ncbi:MAG: hypothetical protein A3H25_03225 [Sphingomonadales bacterium RIFCSPLOWO2_12_FULL_63_15]|nr:MAG: hypothetical protein A3H25_03225 [Sphingomonadales bacterium RIFCSPLOWO2_12_FULL_63_15]
MALRSTRSDLFREHVPGVFKASKAVCRANLASAERKFRAKEFGHCVAHLEAALSSLHDLMNEVGKKILE